MKTFAYFVKTASSTTVPVALTNTTFKVSRITLLGYKAEQTVNVGTVYIGNATNDGKQVYPLLSGESVVIDTGEKQDISKIYIDVVNANDGVIVIYE